tara:strand:- start:363 stop:629 length:267 start_codon:yes stop_codon:yes gene_type:complete
MIWVLLKFEDLVFTADKITKIKTACINEFVNGFGVKVEESVDGYTLIVLKNKLEYKKTHLSQAQLTNLSKQQISEYMEVIQQFGRDTY